MANFGGNYGQVVPASSTVEIWFTTNAAAGGAVAPLSAFEAGDVKLYKDHTATPRSSTSGWTMTSPINSVVGQHQLSIDLSDNTDAGFYAVGHVYTAVLNPDTETVDSQTVVSVIGQFSIGVDMSDTVRLGLTGLANAVPGATGGLLIAGTNAPVTITGSGDALTLTSSGGNGKGLKVTGNGTGDGITATSGAGATGNGITAVSAATAGAGLQATGSGTGNGLGLTGGASGSPNSAVVTTYTIKRATAFTAFTFQMVLSSDHVTPATGKTVTVTRSIDGGAYGASTAGTATEISNGSYKINLSAADLTGNMISILATGTGCDQTVIGIVTQSTA